MERLQKLLARAGIASRRASEKLIVAGRVSVDGETVWELGTKADPSVHEICVDGKLVTFPDKLHYLALHKPVGAVTTRDDERGRETVQDLIDPAVRDFVYPVGRLDLKSSGLILLTNDGALAFRLTHPSHHVPKTYEVECARVVPVDVVPHLRDGVMLDDGVTAPAEVTVDPRDARRLTMMLYEGRKRQIRRMIQSMGNEVTRLHRVAIGPLQLGDLPEGRVRALSAKEVRALRESVGLAP